MPEPWSVHLLDSVVRLSAPEPLLEQLRHLLVPSPGTRLPVVHAVEVLTADLRVDGALSPLPAAPAARLEQLLAVLNALVIEDLGSPAVHAGAVARDGAVLAWPGVSGAGKSTLTAACLRAGLDYVSDEALVLEGDLVRAYPKPLSLDAWSLQAVGLSPPQPGARERCVLPAELGAEVAGGSLRPAHLLRLERRPGPAVLTPDTRASAAMWLVQHAFNHYKDPLAAFTAATCAARGAQCWTLGYASPGDAAELLVGLARR